MKAYCICFTTWTAPGLSNKSRAPVFSAARRDEGAALREQTGREGKGRQSQGIAVDGAGEARQSPSVT